jgi:hypothetical protein
LRYIVLAFDAARGAEDQMATAPGLRISNADREAAAASLRDHFAEGRLTLEEFQHRLGGVFGAKTDRDVAAITADLPAGSAGQGRIAESATAGHRAGGQNQRPWSWPRGVAGLIVIILSLIVVAALLPVALFGSLLSRGVLFLLSLLLFGRRGLLGRLRRWLMSSRRWPF